MEVTGISVERAEEIADASIVSGEVDGSGNLVLTNGAGDDINAGVVRPPPTDPGSVVMSATNVMNGVLQTAGVLKRTPTWASATYAAVEPAGVNMFDQHAQGIIVRVGGVYDVQMTVQCAASYTDGAYFGVNMSSSPFIGNIDQIADWRPKVAGINLQNMAQVTRRMTIPADYMMLLQVLANNNGSTAWATDWAARITITKPW